MTSVTILQALARAGVERADVVRACGLIGLDTVGLRVAPKWMQRMWDGPVAAMTWGDTVFVHPRLLDDPGGIPPRLILHELVHVRQWRQLGKVRFGARYLSEYLSGRLRRRSHRQAYTDISLEREARAVERLIPG